MLLLFGGITRRNQQKPRNKQTSVSSWLTEVLSQKSLQANREQMPFFSKPPVRRLTMKSDIKTTCVRIGGEITETPKIGAGII
jgi:hypothetical protein